MLPTIRLDCFGFFKHSQIGRFKRKYGSEINNIEIELCSFLGIYSMENTHTKIYIEKKKEN